MYDAWSTVRGPQQHTSSPFVLRVPNEFLFPLYKWKNGVNVRITLCVAGLGFASRSWCVSSAWAIMLGILVSLWLWGWHVGPEGSKSGVWRLCSWMGCPATFALRLSYLITHLTGQSRLEATWRKVWCLAMIPRTNPNDLSSRGGYSVLLTDCEAGGPWHMRRLRGLECVSLGTLPLWVKDSAPFFFFKPLSKIFIATRLNNPPLS